MKYAARCVFTPNRYFFSPLMIPFTFRYSNCRFLWMAYHCARIPSPPKSPGSIIIDSNVPPAVTSRLSSSQHLYCWDIRPRNIPLSRSNLTRLRLRLSLRVIPPGKLRSVALLALHWGGFPSADNTTLATIRYCGSALSCSLSLSSDYTNWYFGDFPL